jgi:tetratricopeptide (TPR) repeat protein
MEREAVVEFIQDYRPGMEVPVSFYEGVGELPESDPIRSTLLRFDKKDRNGQRDRCMDELQGLLNCRRSDRVKQAQELADLGNERIAAQDFENAMSLCKAAIDFDCNCVDGLRGVASLLAQGHRWVEASVLLKRVLALRPDDAKAWANLGLYDLQLQDFAGAERAINKARELGGENIATHHNMGLLRFSQNRAEEAVKELTEALVLYNKAGRSDLVARSDLSMAVLKTGKLHEGLKLNEVRWESLKKFPSWDCGLPRWQGEDLSGKTLLLHAEQGYGDSLQFIRFVPKIKQWAFRDAKRRAPSRYPRVIFVAPPALVRLLKGQCACDDVIDMSDLGAMVNAARQSDYHSPLLSAVCLIGEEFDGQPEKAKPYLRPCDRPTGRRAKFSPDVFKVGLVYAASSGLSRSRERSVSLQELLVLAEVPGVQLYSLQVGEFQEELIKSGAQHFVIDLAPRIKDFADTAELCSHLDLVISVDTGPLHAAAAIGTPTWLLQPLTLCWRWCRGAKLWYGCMEEYFQTQPGTWQTPIALMKRDLEKLVAARNGGAKLS